VAYVDETHVFHFGGEGATIRDVRFHTTSGGVSEAAVSGSVSWLLKVAR
jgi:hypothetical protein